MRIILTCNGEYINAHCPSLGHCNDRLSEKGILSSLRLAKELKNQIFDYIFCSDFGYRRTTTDLIVEELIYKNCKIIVDANLREKDAEICTQKSKKIWHNQAILIQKVAKLSLDSLSNQTLYLQPKIPVKAQNKYLFVLKISSTNSFIIIRVLQLFSS